MSNLRAKIRAAYAKVKSDCAVDSCSVDTRKAIHGLVATSLDFLINQCQKIDLRSSVPNKEYISFKKGKAVARPANIAYFITQTQEFNQRWNEWLEAKISTEDFARMSYTAALAPCLAMELFDRQNKKGPATYFECYIGHLFAGATGVKPMKRVLLPIHKRNVRMTMDFLFDLGKRKIHLPVKMSTRERVVQAWAHQRLLNSAYGEGTYSGIMILFSETKLNSRSLEVVEICVPDQWLVYQSLLARMERIYYFDMPARYQELSRQFHDVIAIKPFGEFFNEKATLFLS